MSTTILLCTVGGAHQPIIKAIESTSPRYVCFFCTDKDPETGRPGSIVQVTGKGNVIKANRCDSKPTLPNIPTQTGLDAEQFEAQKIPADDLDGAYLAMRDAITELSRQFSGAQFTADYTGGTKTMTAALVCAALDSSAAVKLHLIAGARGNLDRVEDGTEQPMLASVDRLRLDRTMSPYLGAWRRYAYHEAAEGLNGIQIVADTPGKERLGIARSLSRAFALWDDFDHGGSRKLIDIYASRVAQCFLDLLRVLRLLTNENDARREPARLFDLWLNAERRAKQGRFDDAVARWYRLMEWTAQWQLQTKLDVKTTADFPRDKLPPNLHVAPASNGKIKLGLMNAWQVVEYHLSGPAQVFIAKHENRLRGLTELRNNSILAHGFEPVKETDWQDLHSWTKESFLPVLRDLATEAGLKNEPKQLPTELPEC